MPRKLYNNLSIRKGLIEFLNFVCVELVINEWDRMPELLQNLSMWIDKESWMQLYRFHALQEIFLILFESQAILPENNDFPTVRGQKSLSTYSVVFVFQNSYLL